MSDIKGIYQPWSHEEFMADRRVRRMSPTALKTYMMLLHEAYVCSCRPYLPDDEEELELMAYCESKEEWESVRDVVLGMFEKRTVNGTSVLANKRLERDWQNLQDIREAKSAGGKKGAAKRWGGIPIGDPEVTLTPDSKEVKEVSKEIKQSKISEGPQTENPENGQDLPEDWNEEIMKTERQIDIMTQQFFNKKAYLRGANQENLKRLVLLHKGSAVERAYGEWCQQNQDNPDIKDPVATFLYDADDLLSSETPFKSAAKDPEVVSLTRELTYVSEGQICFMDKQRARLAEVLKEFSSEEIVSAFKTWLQDQDLSDPKQAGFAAGKFAQIADSLAYANRRRREERGQEQKLREAAVAKLQAEAEERRKELEAKEREEAEAFDPLAD